MVWFDATLFWYVISGPDHSVIDCNEKGGNVFLRAVTMKLRNERAQDFYNIGGVGHCSVGVSFVGLREPRATLALWLGLTPRYHGT